MGWPPASPACQPVHNAPAQRAPPTLSSFHCIITTAANPALRALLPALTWS